MASCRAAPAVPRLRRRALATLSMTTRAAVFVALVLLLAQCMRARQSLGFPTNLLWKLDCLQVSVAGRRRAAERLTLGVFKSTMAACRLLCKHVLLHCKTIDDCMGGGWQARLTNS